MVRCSIANNMTKMAAGVLACVLVTTLGACANSSEQVVGTADNPVEITLWTWQSTIQDWIRPFEKSHPGIKVKVANVGTNEDEYMQLTNALEAGKGIPDVVYLDFNAVHQFAIGEHLRDLGEYGFDDIKKDFTDAAQGNVSVGGKAYGIPISSGPMVMFYNKVVFDKAGVTQPPTTWDEYRSAAEKIKAASNGEARITNDTGDGGFLTSMMWQADARPFSVEGSTVSVNMKDKNVVKFTDMWQQLLDGDLLDTSTPMWTDDWWHKLDDGSIASVLTGAWLVSSMQKNLSATKGQWRIAAMPQYKAGEHANGENGGGALAMPKGSDDAKTKAAYTFMEWFGHGAGTKIDYGQGGLPPVKSVLDDEEFLSMSNEFFGGQKINEVIAQSAKDVLPGFDYLPYMAYANTIIVDSVGDTYQGNRPLQQSLERWGKSLKEYGKQQGFTIK